MSDITVNIRDFTTIPGPRFKKSGENSAEEFFERFLQPKLDDSSIDHITIDFSGTWGYSSSFTSQLGIYLIDYLGSFDAVERKISAFATDNDEVVPRFWKQAREDI